MKELSAAQAARFVEGYATKPRPNIQWVLESAATEWADSHWAIPIDLPMTKEAYRQAFLAGARWGKKVIDGKVEPEGQKMTELEKLKAHIAKLEAEAVARTAQDSAPAPKPAPWGRGGWMFPWGKDYDGRDGI